MEKEPRKRELEGLLVHCLIASQVILPLIKKWKSRQIMFWRENQIPKFPCQQSSEDFFVTFDSMGRRYDRNVLLQFTINGIAGQNYLSRSHSL